MKVENSKITAFEFYSANALLQSLKISQERARERSNDQEHTAPREDVSVSQLAR